MAGLITLDEIQVRLLARIDQLEDGMRRGKREVTGFVSDAKRQFRGLGLDILAMDAAVNLAVRGFSLFNVHAITGAAAEVEALKTRLVNLTGSERAASEQFNRMVKLAATTPFQLQGIVEAGVTLQAFGDKNDASLKAIADLAAFMGTDVVEAAASYGRAFAAGAGAADILRERGVLALIRTRTGIDDLTKLSLPEFRKILFESMVDPLGPIAGATDRLSRTWIGAVSNMQDAGFQLRAELGKIITDSSTVRGLILGATDAMNMMAGGTRDWVDSNRDLIELRIGKTVDAFKDSLHKTFGTLDEFLLKLTNIERLWQRMKLVVAGGIAGYIASGGNPLGAIAGAWIADTLSPEAQVINDLIAGKTTLAEILGMEKDALTLSDDTWDTIKYPFGKPLKGQHDFGHLGPNLFDQVLGPLEADEKFAPHEHIKNLANKRVDEELAADQAFLADTRKAEREAGFSFADEGIRDRTPASADDIASIVADKARADAEKAKKNKGTGDNKQQIADLRELIGLRKQQLDNAKDLESTEQIHARVAELTKLEGNLVLLTNKGKARGLELDKLKAAEQEQYTKLAAADFANAQKVSQAEARGYEIRADAAREMFDSLHAAGRGEGAAAALAEFDELSKKALQIKRDAAQAKVDRLEGLRSSSSEIAAELADAKVEVLEIDAAFAQSNQTVRELRKTSEETASIWSNIGLEAKSSFQDAVKGLALGTGTLGDFGKRFGSSVFGGALDDILPKLAEGATNAAKRIVLSPGQEGHPDFVGPPSPPTDGAATGAAAGGAAASGIAAAFVVALFGSIGAWQAVKAERKKFGTTDDDVYKAGARGFAEGAGLGKGFGFILENTELGKQLELAGIFKAPSAATQERIFLKKLFKERGFTGLGVNVRPYEAPVPDAQGWYMDYLRGASEPVSRDVKGFTPETTALVKLLRFGPGKKGIGGDEAFISRGVIGIENQLTQLDLASDDIEALIDQFITATGEDWEKTTSKLISLRGEGKLTNAEFVDLLGNAVRGFEALPDAIDESVIALASIDDQGKVSLERVKRLVEDAKSTIGAGFTEQIKDALLSGDYESPARTVAERFGDTFAERLNERLLEKALIGPAFTQALELAERGFEMYLAGDKQGGLGLLALAKTAYKTGEKELVNILKFLGPIGPGFLQSFYEPSTPGVVGQGIPSFDTPTFTRVPGARGAAMMAMVHGGEPIRSPAQEDSLMAKVDSLIAQVAAGGGGSVGGDTYLTANITVEVDGRVYQKIERRNIRLQRTGETPLAQRIATGDAR